MNELRTKRQRERTNVFTNLAQHPGDCSQRTSLSSAQQPGKKFYKKDTTLRKAPSGGGGTVQKIPIGLLKKKNAKDEVLAPGLSNMLVYLIGGTEPKPNHWINSEFRQKKMLCTRCPNRGSIGGGAGFVGTVRYPPEDREGGEGGRKLVRTVT